MHSGNVLTLAMLIDSGATANLIHQATALQLHLLLYLLQSPCKISTINVTSIDTGETAHYTKPMTNHLSAIHQEIIIPDVTVAWQNPLILCSRSIMARQDHKMATFLPPSLSAKPKFNTCQDVDWKPRPRITCVCPRGVLGLQGHFFFLSKEKVAAYLHIAHMTAPLTSSLELHPVQLCLHSITHQAKSHKRLCSRSTPTGLYKAIHLSAISQVLLCGEERQQSVPVHWFPGVRPDCCKIPISPTASSFCIRAAVLCMHFHQPGVWQRKGRMENGLQHHFWSLQIHGRAICTLLHPSIFQCFINDMLRDILERFVIADPSIHYL